MNPKRLYYALLAAIAVLVLLVGAGFVLGNRLIDSRISELERLQADNVFAGERLDKLEKLENNYAEIESLADKVRDVLPTSKQQAEVSAQIEKIVNSAGLELSSLAFETTSGLPSDTSQTTKSPVGGTLVMPVQFSITSNYQQLQTLLRKFENQERYMRVRTLQISRGAEDQLTFTVQLEVFIAP